MGWKLSPELEAKCLAMAEPLVLAPAMMPVFADEAAFQAAIVELAKANGWLCYHTRDSRKCEPGFPDLIMLRGGVMIVAELKRSNKNPTAAQNRWLKAFQLVAECRVYIWRFEDWKSITEILQ